MLKSIYTIFFFFTFTAYSVPSPLFHYDFASPKEIFLHDGAKISKGTLHLDGQKSYAIIPGSRDFNLTAKGMTIICVAKFNGQIIGQDLISKKGGFLFSRDASGMMYFSFNNGKNWVAGTHGGSRIPIGEWAHYALVVTRIDNPGEGKQGYLSKIYINGELEAEVETFNQEPVFRNEPIIVGRGEAGNAWAMNGEIAEVSIYDSSLNDDDIKRIALSSKKVKIASSDACSVNETLNSKLKIMANQASTPAAQWAVASMRRAATNGANQEQILKVAISVEKLLLEKIPITELAKSWNITQDVSKILVSDGLAAMLIDGADGTFFPLIGLFNRHTGKEIFGNTTLHWRVMLKGSREKPEVVSSNSPDLKRNIVSDDTSICIKWYHDNFTLTTNFIIHNDRLETDINVFSINDEYLIREVTYPAFRLAPLQLGEDKLLYPSMAGEIVNNPTIKRSNRIRYNWYYPSTYVDMQFGAYYDKQSGIYFAFEDPKGKTKQYSASAQKGFLDVYWKSFAPYKPGQTGQNKFEMTGKGVIQVYGGGWFPAGQIYKNFLSSRAEWWIKELPRTDSPKWFMECPLWICLRPENNKAKALLYKKQMIYLRNYFELPFGVHWYHWDDRQKGHWPHFYAYDYFPLILKELKEAGIYSKAYIDSRLWAENDGGNSDYDWMYSTHGKKYAVKNSDGRMNYEHYEVGTKKLQKFTIMCPAVKDWQNWMLNMCKRVAGYGFNAIYHDEIAAARPYACFDPSHRHDLNDGNTWLSGYIPMLEAIHHSMPDVAQDTEEAAEPYSRVLDGFMCWRWNGNIPLFASIYSGRIQITGRFYFWYPAPEMDQQFFVKAGVQLVSAEQIGWFFPSDMSDPKKRLYIKKLIHLRRNLLKYLNEGEMLAPLTFRVNPNTVTCSWGSMQGQGGDITSPEVLSATYHHPSGMNLIIFVNSVNKKVDFQPIINYGGNFMAIFSEDSKPEIHPYSGAVEPHLSISPLSSKVVLLGDQKNSEFTGEVKRIETLMNRISCFTPGLSMEDFDALQKTKKNIAAAPDTWVNIRDASAFLRCAPSEDMNYLGKMEENAIISYGIVDFGMEGGTQLELELLVTREQAGGKIEFLVGNGLDVLASLDIGHTEGYTIIDVPIRKQLTGKQQVMVRFQSADCCTFKKWRIRQ